MNMLYSQTILDSLQDDEFYDDFEGNLPPLPTPPPPAPKPEGGAWWGCAESYRASGRPSRIWAEWTPSPSIRPDDDLDGRGTPYPFNGMGGSVETGPHASKEGAITAVNAMIYEDGDGYLQWR